VLRIEDTDKKREVKGAAEEIGKLLKLFGLGWDEYYVQSERAAKGIYEQVAVQLVAEGKAFYCQCEARNAKRQGYSKVLRDPCRDKSLKSGAIKLKVPEKGEVKYKDYVLGKEIVWQCKEVADATLLKSDGFPTYHLAVVVDDHEMKISHMLRGYDWLPSTPVHLLVYDFLGYERPEIGHLTDILDPKGGKLSKRSGSVSVESFLKEGYLAEALLNFVMLLGWAPKDNREMFSLEEFVERFGPEGLQKANPRFDREKLLWMNGEYIREMTDEKLAGQIGEYYEGKYDSEKIRETMPLVKTRIKLLAEYEDLAGFFFERPEVDDKLLGEKAKEHLTMANEALSEVKNWGLGEINERLMAEIEKGKFKTGKFFMDLRVAITGRNRWWY